MNTTDLFVIYAIAITIATLLYLAIYIPFALTLRNTLRAVSFENREMRPGQVWLMLIPLFNFVWAFITVSRVANSIQKEFISRGVAIDNKPTYGIGLAYSILQCIPFALSLLNSDFSKLPVSILANLGCLVCWIIYWVKVAEYKNKLLQLPAKNEDSLIFGHIHQ